MKVTFLDEIPRAGDGAGDKSAFRYLSDELTYGDLADRAERLAGELQNLGVGRGSRVVLFMDKSLAAPVAIYGVLAAGACFVPLDTSAPATRVRQILAECEPSVILCDPSKVQTAQDAVSGLEAQPIVKPFDLSCLPSGDTAHRPPPDRSTEDPAYILFSSGSTGVPKGIVHTHKSALAYAHMAADLYGLGPGDVMGNHSPLHFDMSTFELFAGPLRGATTVLIADMYRKLPASMSALMASERMTVWYSVPFALIQLIDRGVLEQRDLSALRWVIFAGEPLQPSYLSRLQEALPAAQFSNAYGPTETNVITHYRIETSPWDKRIPIPLGQACSGARLRIERTGEAPETGELLACGDTVMSGYWRRPDLDRAAFCYREDGDGTQRRYYRTGDLVRRDERGVLHYLGRKDRQVKLRGYRIELSEVENALTQHPAVKEAAALLSEDGEKLLAFATIIPGSDVEAGALKAFLGLHLPAYAVPHSATILPSFARTPSGKIDRRALGNKLPA